MASEAPLCPSSTWNAEGARVFGVVGGEAKAPRVLFLKQIVTPSKELEAKLNGRAPEEVFRIASPCDSKCGHHNSATHGCNLVGNIVEHTAPVYDDYSTCTIRATCVWWAQEGIDACVRCPQVVRKNKLQSEAVHRAATMSVAASAAVSPAQADPAHSR